MLYAIILHFLAGGVTGTTFKVQTLAAVLCIVIFEFLVVAIVQGSVLFGWALASLVAVQFGYVSGILTRGVFAYARGALRADKGRSF